MNRQDLQAQEQRLDPLEREQKFREIYHLYPEVQAFVQARMRVQWSLYFQQSGLASFPWTDPPTFPNILPLPGHPYHWTDLPFENGRGVYQTTLGVNDLTTGLYLYEFFSGSRSLELLKIQEVQQLFQGYQGGGQIARSSLEPGRPLDRFTTAPERIAFFCKKIDESVRLPSVAEIVKLERDRLHLPENSGERHRWALRWNMNLNGEIPKPSLPQSLLSLVR